ncbi:hypothetical protein Plhal710r2_c064g0173571 [Plasmopara halstedii]
MACHLHGQQWGILEFQRAEIQREGLLGCQREEFQREGLLGCQREEFQRGVILGCHLVEIPEYQQEESSECLVVNDRNQSTGV